MAMTELLFPAEFSSRGGDSFLGGDEGSETGETTMDLLRYW